MKLTATALFLYFSLLTAQPLLAGICISFHEESEQTCDENCCNSDNKDCEQESDKKSDSNNCCTNGICNPFEQCACCYGIPINQKEYKFLSDLTITEISTDYIDIPLSSFSSDCFQPPEII